MGEKKTTITQYEDMTQQVQDTKMKLEESELKREELLQKHKSMEEKLNKYQNETLVHNQPIINRTVEHDDDTNEPTTKNMKSIENIQENYIEKSQHISVISEKDKIIENLQRKLEEMQETYVEKSQHNSVISEKDKIVENLQKELEEMKENYVEKSQLYSEVSVKEKIIEDLQEKLKEMTLINEANCNKIKEIKLSHNDKSGFVYGGGIALAALGGLVGISRIFFHLKKKP